MTEVSQLPAISSIFSRQDSKNDIRSRDLNQLSGYNLPPISQIKLVDSCVSHANTGNLNRKPFNKNRFKAYFQYRNKLTKFQLNKAEQTPREKYSKLYLQNSKSYLNSQSNISLNTSNTLAQSVIDRQEKQLANLQKIAFLEELFQADKGNMVGSPYRFKLRNLSSKKSCSGSQNKPFEDTSSIDSNVSQTENIRQNDNQLNSAYVLKKEKHRRESPDRESQRSPGKLSQKLSPLPKKQQRQDEQANNFGKQSPFTQSHNVRSNFINAFLQYANHRHISPIKSQERKQQTDALINSFKQELYNQQSEVISSETNQQSKQLQQADQQEYNLQKSTLEKSQQNDQIVDQHIQRNIQATGSDKPKSNLIQNQADSSISNILQSDYEQFGQISQKAQQLQQELLNHQNSLQSQQNQSTNLKQDLQESIQIDKYQQQEQIQQQLQYKQQEHQQQQEQLQAQTQQNDQSNTQQDFFNDQATSNSDSTNESRTYEQGIKTQSQYQMYHNQQHSSNSQNSSIPSIDKKSYTSYVTKDNYSGSYSVPDSLLMERGTQNNNTSNLRNSNVQNDVIFGGKRILGQRYEVVKKMGEGAYGLVWKCLDQQTKKYVAIKEYKIQEDDVDYNEVKICAEREISIMIAVQCDQVVKFHQDFMCREKIYIVMDLVPFNLMEILDKSQNGLHPKQVQYIIQEIIKALFTIHSKKYIYRDLKPENILLTTEGQIKLCDFGFARSRAQNLIEPLTDYVGTRWYRAPELLLGPQYFLNQIRMIDYGPKVDIWALGCLMYELLTGQALFIGDNDYEQLQVVIQSLGHLPTRLLQIYLQNPYNKMLEFKDPTEDTSIQFKLQDLSQLEREFIMQCLIMDPDSRISLQECIAHPYVQNN